ncbi:hypothetical protein [uncultured Marinobacter sp.]|uniref:hypothetical protein n=1 Tax=uncultured Marinobacter sp. TaxID=187379 RepID=UPI0025E45EAF|nr:hypothetical protein [uncultured Marinobacter sp.]
MAWQEVINFLGGATAISLTVAFLGKKAIEAFLQGRIESYKKNLERIASENSIRFQRLHSERAEIIKDFYEKLAVLDDTLYSTLRPFQAVGEPELEEKVKELSVQFNDLREYFLPKRIFFENDLCELIDKILETAKGVFFDITTFPVDIKDTHYKYDRGLLKERHEFWEKARNIHNNEIASLKRDLEDEFRQILGIKA